MKIHNSDVMERQPPSPSPSPSPLISMFTSRDSPPGGSWMEAKPMQQSGLLGSSSLLNLAVLAVTDSDDSIDSGDDHDLGDDDGDGDGNGGRAKTWEATMNKHHREHDREHERTDVTVTDLESCFSTGAIKIESNATNSASLTSEDSKGQEKGKVAELVGGTSNSNSHSNSMNYHIGSPAPNRSRTRSSKELMEKLKACSFDVDVDVTIPPSIVPQSTRSSVLESVISDFITREKVLRKIRHKYSFSSNENGNRNRNGNRKWGESSWKDILAQRTNENTNTNTNHGVPKKIPSVITIVKTTSNVFQDKREIQPSPEEEDAVPVPVPVPVPVQVPQASPTHNGDTIQCKTLSEKASERLHEDVIKRQKRRALNASTSTSTSTANANASASEEHNNSPSVVDTDVNTNSIHKTLDKEDALVPTDNNDVFNRLYSYSSSRKLVGQEKSESMERGAEKKEEKDDDEDENGKNHNPPEDRDSIKGMEEKKPSSNHDGDGSPSSSGKNPSKKMRKKDGRTLYLAKSKAAPALVSKSPLSKTNAKLIAVFSHLLHHGDHDGCSNAYAYGHGYGYGNGYGYGYGGNLDCDSKKKELLHVHNSQYLHGYVDGKVLRSIQQLHKIQKQNAHHYVRSPISYKSRLDVAIKRKFGLV